MANDKATNKTAEIAVNRRSVLKAVGTTGAVSAGFGTMGIAKAGTKSTQEDLEATSLKGRQRQDLLESVTADSDFRKIRSEFNEAGWERQTDEAICLRTEPETEEPLDLAVVPFRNNGEEGQFRAIVGFERNK